MKILILTSVLPFHRRNGGEICTARLIDQLLEKGHEVWVLGRGEAPVGTQPPNLRISWLGEQARTFAQMPASAKAWSLTAALGRREPWTVQRMRAGIEAELRRQLADLDHTDLVMVDHLQVWPWLSLCSWSGPTVLVAHNVEPSVYGALARFHVGVQSWTIRREARMLSRLDRQVASEACAVACLTPSDAAYYEALVATAGSRATVGVLPSFPAVADAPRRLKPASVRRVGLIGTWTWESNRAGLLWFFREVVPRIGPEVQIAVAGSGLDPVDVPPRVRALGFVESVASFYDECDVIAIPTVAGSGIQEKTVEAIGRALPIIATPLAVRGIDPLPAHVHVVDGCEAFAAACSQWELPATEFCWEAAHNWSNARRSEYHATLERLLGLRVSSVP